MAEAKLTKKELQRVEELVSHFELQRHQFDRIAGELNAAFTTYPKLKALVHSLRWRIKNPDHLKKKLVRKWIAAKKSQKSFDVTTENLFQKVNDLVGFRVLHLYTREVERLNPALIECLSEGYKLVEGPCARTWDDESRAYFESIGIKTDRSERMYTSVHYVFETRSVTKFTVEVQVRTLAEELWGEVDHQLNYPDPVGVVACSEQIKVLAKVTSACNRLVDSIFKSLEVVSSKKVHERKRTSPRSKRRVGR